ncbi:hypothetical protein GCM10010872_28140 [Dyella flava]|nr:hypothetical protein GCM10010872_28140 [Dyella flava]
MLFFLSPPGDAKLVPVGERTEVRGQPRDEVDAQREHPEKHHVEAITLEASPAPHPTPLPEGEREPMRERQPSQHVGETELFPHEYKNRQRNHSDIPLQNISRHLIPQHSYP